MEETNKLTEVEEAMRLGNLVASEKDVVRTPLVDALKKYFIDHSRTVTATEIMAGKY